MMETASRTLAAIPAVVLAAVGRGDGAAGARLLRRLVGLALVGLLAALLGRVWHPVYRFTGLLQLDGRNEARMLGAVRAAPVAYFDGGYDGQFYAQLACDPSLRDPELPKAIDSLSYRARRILLPAVAWAAGFGRPEWAFHVYSWLNIAGWLVLAGLLWPLLEADRRWLGLLAWTGVMFSAGMLVSVRYALTDLPAVLLFVLAMRAATPAGRAGWFGACLLTRESMLVGAWGLLEKAWDRPGRLVRPLGWLAAALVPLLLWVAYVRWRAGQTSGGIGNFAWPGSGLLGDWREGWAALASGQERKYAVLSVLATFSLTLQAVFLVVGWNPADRWWRAGAGSVALLLVLGPAVWEGLFGANLRVLLPLTLACNVLALRRRGALWWLLAFNLSVPAAISEMTPILDHRELATVRRGAAAAVLRGNDGCYGRERLGESLWVWMQPQAEWTLRSWTGGERTALILSAKVRGIDVRVLTISHGARELWRGSVGAEWLEVRLDLGEVPEGVSSLVFRSDAPAVRESDEPDARSLAVCVLNPVLELDTVSAEENAGDRSGTGARP